jgi:hypothetical protein
MLVHAREKRMLIASMVIETLRAYCKAHFKDEMIGVHFEEILIGLAILIGQSEGRPMTASDIAVFVGIPRPTVIRHLQPAIKSKAVISKKDGRRHPYYVLAGNEPEVVGEIVKLFDKYAKLCGQLSKLDDKEFVTPPRSG